MKFIKTKNKKGLFSVKRLLLIIILIMLVMTFVGCSNQQTVVGRWGTIESYKMRGDTKIPDYDRFQCEFTESGRYYVNKYYVNTSVYEYEVVSDSELLINGKYTWEYEFKDGHLIIQDANHNYTVFERLE